MLGASRWIGGHGPTAAIRPQDTPRAKPGAPAWAFKPQTRCVDSCCPPTAISTASTGPTGPYDSPPSAYPSPGLASQALPYATMAGGLPDLRGTAGPGRGTVLSSPYGFAGAAPPAAWDLGGRGLGADRTRRSGLRIGAPSMHATAWSSLGAGASAWQGAAPPAATPGGAALDTVRGPGNGFKCAQPPPRAAAALDIPGGRGCM